MSEEYEVETEEEKQARIESYLSRAGYGIGTVLKKPLPTQEQIEESRRLMEEQKTKKEELEEQLTQVLANLVEATEISVETRELIEKEVKKFLEERFKTAMTMLNVEILKYKKAILETQKLRLSYVKEIEILRDRFLHLRKETEKQYEEYARKTDELNALIVEYNKKILDLQAEAKRFNEWAMRQTR